MSVNSRGEDSILQYNSNDMNANESITESQLRQSYLRNKRTDSYVPNDAPNKGGLPFNRKAYASSFAEEERKIPKSNKKLQKERSHEIR